MKNFISANDYYKKRFGEKVYRISLDAGFTCPNRDGKIGYGGCIFCSEGGSGDFAGDRNVSIKKQLESGKRLLRGKIKNCHKFIAYFQAFTNTYAPVDVLRQKFTEAITERDVVALSIATRPDCISDECLKLLAELNAVKPMWVELGLQTIHEVSAKFIRRGFALECYDEAVRRLKDAGIEIITHVILGLPCESEEMMLETVRYVCGGVNGIKLQLLHVLKNTELGCLYEKEPFNIMTLEEYGNVLAKVLAIIPPEIVVHRITGDPPKRILIEPKWSADKKTVLNYLNKRLGIR